ncbi:uncharacterized protein LOC119648429 [Hermetia illucens]|uniref:uncharacterized protein LOC119648429 n=1 Tax=Hermetia illucens TaxID=343691 RepID=UPI0018CBF335|nr:uncharacterized protein LOC119648429 [Hermetia illucens]
MDPTQNLDLYFVEIRGGPVSWDNTSVAFYLRVFSAVLVFIVLLYVCTPLYGSVEFSITTLLNKDIGNRTSSSNSNAEASTSAWRSNDLVFRFIQDYKNSRVNGMRRMKYHFRTL